MFVEYCRCNQAKLVAKSLEFDKMVIVKKREEERMTERMTERERQRRRKQHRRRG